MYPRFLFLLVPGRTRLATLSSYQDYKREVNGRKDGSHEDKNSGVLTMFTAGVLRKWRSLTRRRAVAFCSVCFVVCLWVIWVSVNDDFVGEAEIVRSKPYWLGSNLTNHLVGELRASIRTTRRNHSKHFESPDWRELWSLRPSNPHLAQVSCQAMLRGDQEEIERSREYMRRAKSFSLSDADYVNLTRDCDYFRRSRGYITRPLSEVEANFPIAFSILMYKDAHQVERLLRSVYMPQNYYCIHVDLKSSPATKLAMRAIAGCFHNVFVASELESVFWGHISIMYAEMNCIKDLLKYDWKYFINLSGQMFPLHTNRQLVEILTLYAGANDIEGSYERSKQFGLTLRTSFSWRYSKLLDSVVFTIFPKTKAPHNVTVYKGSNQVAMSRAFAVYYMYSPVARDLVEWFADTLAPDEYIWPTLNHNPHLHFPGAYKGDPETKPFTARASLWLPVANQRSWSGDSWECQGKWVREICIFGLGDLPWLSRRPELFANKFHADFEWLALDCLEQLLFNRTVSGANLNLDPTYYGNLPFVQHKELVVSVEESLSDI